MPKITIQYAKNCLNKLDKIADAPHTGALSESLLQRLDELNLLIITLEQAIEQERGGEYIENAATLRAINEATIFIEAEDNYVTEFVEEGDEIDPQFDGLSDLTASEAEEEKNQDGSSDGIVFFTVADEGEDEGSIIILHNNFLLGQDIRRPTGPDNAVLSNDLDEEKEKKEDEEMKEADANLSLAQDNISERSPLEQSQEVFAEVVVSQSGGGLLSIIGSIFCCTCISSINHYTFAKGFGDSFDHDGHGGGGVF